MWTDLALLSPTVIPTVLGLVVLLVGVFAEKGAAKGWLGLVTALGFALALAALWWVWKMAPEGLSSPALAASVSLDPFGLALWAIILVGGLLTTLTAVHYLPAQRSDHAEYYALVCFATVGMMAMVTAGDLLTLFVALEVMSIAVYILAGFKRQSPFAVEAAMKYFILGSFASALLLLGIAFVYGATGSLRLTEVGRLIGLSDGVSSNPFTMLGMLFILGAFAFKIAAVPFHMWTPDVYEGAPSSVAGLMAVAVKTAAFGAFARVILTAFGDPALRGDLLAEARMAGGGTETVWVLKLGWEPIVAGLAVLSMTVGNLMALAQKNLKRILAYSAIAHTGYLLVAVVSARPESPAGVPLAGLGGGLVFYLLAYTLANVGAFAVASAVGGDDTEDISEAAYAGLGRKDPVLGLVLVLSILSLLGIPATAGFMGKLAIFSEAMAEPNGYLWLVLVAVANSVVSAWYYLRILVVAYMQPEAGPIRLVASTPLRWAAILAAVLTLGAGLLPSKPLHVSRRAGSSLARSITPGLTARATSPPAEAPPTGPR
jgi:NADH-quinone oxidoreductase subunit N